MIAPNLNARHVRCSGCGAPAGEPAALRCGYCRTSLGKLACPSCHSRMAPGVSFCPRCGTGTVTLTDVTSSLRCPCGSADLTHRAIPVSPGTTGGPLLLADCASCFGMWLSRKTVERLIASHADDTILLALAPGVSARSASRAPGTGMTEVRYRPCPDCGTIMNRVNYARISGIVVDVCKQHGTWFDAQELPALLDFVRRGGLDVARSRETVALADERRRLERERAMRTQPEAMRGNGHVMWTHTGERANGAGLFTLLGALFTES